MESGGNSNTTARPDVTMAMSYPLNCEGGIGASRRRARRCGRSSNKVSAVLGNKSKGEKGQGLSSYVCVFLVRPPAPEGVSRPGLRICNE
jgi:hypothetical protein